MEWAALTVSAAAFSLSVASWLFGRRDRVCDRVWKVLTESPANVRSLDALDEHEDQAQRLELMKRTARSLDLAGAKSLGDALRRVCDEQWGAQTTKEARREREAFLGSVKRFMN